MKHQPGGMSALQKTTVVPLFMEAFPQIFKRSLEHEIKPLIQFLEDLGIRGSGLRKVILCHPPFLLQDPKTDLVPRKRTLRKVNSTVLVGLGIAWQFHCLACMTVVIENLSKNPLCQSELISTKTQHWMRRGRTLFGMKWDKTRPKGK